MKVFEGSLSVGMSFVFDRGGGLDGRSVVLEARKSLAIVQGRCRRRLFVCLAFTGSALNFVTARWGRCRHGGGLHIIPSLTGTLLTWKNDQRQTAPKAPEQQYLLNF